MRLQSAAFAAAFVSLAAPSAAQSLGTFSWQLQPLCNRLVATVRQQGATYTLDGYDDQCGAATRAPLKGLATPNPDGTIGIGLTIITSPGATPVHVDARLTLPGLSGAWSDSHGNTGMFAFGAAAAGTARPAAPSGLSWGRTLVAPATASSSGLDVRQSASPRDRQHGVMVEWGESDAASIVLEDDPVGIVAAARDRPAIVGASDTGVAVSGRTLGAGAGVIGVAVGTVPTARAVAGQASAAGTGVAAETFLGTAVVAASNSGTALRVQGPILARGPRAPAFVHTTTTGNTVGHVTTLSHAEVNGRADALLFVTRRSGSDPSVTSVAYDAGSGRWRLVHDDLSPMPLGRTFTVLVVHPWQCPPDTLCPTTLIPGVVR